MAARSAGGGPARLFAQALRDFPSVPGSASTEQEYEGVQKVETEVRVLRTIDRGLRGACAEPRPLANGVLHSAAERTRRREGGVEGDEDFPGQRGRPFHGAEHRCLGPRLCQANRLRAHTQPAHEEHPWLPTEESDRIWIASNHFQGEPPRTCATSAPGSASAAEASLHSMD